MTDKTTFSGFLFCFLLLDLLKENDNLEVARTSWPTVTLVPVPLSFSWSRHCFHIKQNICQKTSNELPCNDLLKHSASASATATVKIKLIWTTARSKMFYVLWRICREVDAENFLWHVCVYIYIYNILYIYIYIYIYACIIFSIYLTLARKITIKSKPWK